MLQRFRLADAVKRIARYILDQRIDAILRKRLGWLVTNREFFQASSAHSIFIDQLSHVPPVVCSVAIALIGSGTAGDNKIYYSMYFYIPQYIQV